MAPAADHSWVHPAFALLLTAALALLAPLARPASEPSRVVIAGVAGARPRSPAPSGASRGAPAVPPLVRVAAPRGHAALRGTSASARQLPHLFSEQPAATSPCGFAGNDALLPLSAEMVRAHAGADGRVAIVALASGVPDMLRSFSAQLLQRVGECAVLVGMMDPGGNRTLLARQLQAAGVGVYAALGSVQLEQPSAHAPRAGGGGGGGGVRNAQAGRWAHALHFLRVAAAARVHAVLVSDVDVAWVRDPRPYVLGALAAHGAVDALVSTDASNDGARMLGLRPHPRLRGAPAELELEAAPTCAKSLNIGILAARPSAGGLALLGAAARAAAELPWGKSDQGPINRAWKGQTTVREWQGTAGHACAMLGGGARLGVLPAAQFLSALSFQVRALHTLRQVEPIGVHATFLRWQRPANKLMRLRELGLFADPPSHYTDGRFLTYTPVLPRPLLEGADTLPPRGVPARHLRLMAAQHSQFSAALAAAHALGRALVLPRVRCTCEYGLGPGHVREGCDASSPARLPHDCPADHWLDAALWLRGTKRGKVGDGFAHREKGFLEDPRVPLELLRSRARARECARDDGAPADGCCLRADAPPASDDELRAALGGCAARVLDLGDVRTLFRAHARQADALAFWEQLRGGTGSWCCSEAAEYDGTFHHVPYTPASLLPYAPEGAHLRANGSAAAAALGGGGGAQDESEAAGFVATAWTLGWRQQAAGRP